MLFILLFMHFIDKNNCMYASKGEGSGAGGSGVGHNGVGQKGKGTEEGRYQGTRRQKIKFPIFGNRESGRRDPW